MTRSPSPALAAIVANLETRDELRDPDFDAIPNRISLVCRGWSTPIHYRFFKALLDEIPWARRWLILGVYMGRDIAFIQAARKHYHPGRAIEITGVDLFSDGPCNDWPEEMRGKSWEEAGFGPPPTKAQALHNLEELELDHRVSLIQGSDDAVLASLRATGAVFDVVYIDTAHDYDTVARQIVQARGVTHPASIICGDDWQPRGTWDVAGAVRAAFDPVVVFGNTIWVADVPSLKPPRSTEGNEGNEGRQRGDAQLPAAASSYIKEGV